MADSSLFELQWAHAGGCWRAQVAVGSLQRLGAPAELDAAPALDLLRDGRPCADISCAQLPIAIHVAANGGLISNLRVWENVVLPLWYRQALQPETEARVLTVLAAIADPGLDAELWLHRPSGALDLQERRMASLLRAIIAPAPLILLDAGCLEELGKARRRRWLQVLQREVSSAGRAVLCFCSTGEWLEVLEAELPLLDWMDVHETVAG